MDQPATKTCPYCREEIHAEATRCKHCQGDLVQHAEQQKLMEDIQRSGGYLVASEPARLTAVQWIVMAIISALVFVCILNLAMR